MSWNVSPKCGIMVSSKKTKRARRQQDSSPTAVFDQASEESGAFFIPREAAMQQKRNRPDKDGTHRGAFEKNKKKIYATQTVCGICGKPVDFSLKYPHPLSACIDHIIPIAKGGHPSDIENMQLAHWTCNRQKSDHLVTRKEMKEEVISNRVLPHTFDWLNYRSK